MPGMMDTILNTRIERRSRRGPRERDGQPALRERLLPPPDPDVRRRHGQHRRLPLRTRSPSSRQTAEPRRTSTCPPDDLAVLIETYKAIYLEETVTFPQDARDQLTQAVRAVFESWDNPRAQVYRRAHHIADDLGTAVNVVQMVFGNKGDGSGTGVCFTRPFDRRGRPLRGVPGRRAGRGRGRQDPHPGAARTHEQSVPKAFDELLETMRQLEDHCHDMQDVQFTVEDEAALPAADSRRQAGGRRGAEGRRGHGRGLISREDAVIRIDPDQLDQLLHPR